MVDADAAMQHLLHLRANSLRPVQLVDLGVQPALLVLAEQR
jgi:hypothetical protein